MSTVLCAGFAFELRVSFTLPRAGLTLTSVAMMRETSDVATYVGRLSNTECIHCARFRIATLTTHHKKNCELQFVKVFAIRFKCAKLMIAQKAIPSERAVFFYL